MFCGRWELLLVSMWTLPFNSSWLSQYGRGWSVIMHMYSTQVIPPPDPQSAGVKLTEIIVAEKFILNPGEAKYLICQKDRELIKMVLFCHWAFFGHEVAKTMLAPLLTAVIIFSHYFVMSAFLWCLAAFLWNCAVTKQVQLILMSG